MTRSEAREFAMHIILDVDYTNDEASQVLESRINSDYYPTLKGEADVYATVPEAAQLDYIRKVSTGVQDNKIEILSYISKYAIGWNIERISRITRAILELAIYEIRSVEDVPASVAVNEAVNLTKKYDSDETASFVNGILGSFIRGESIS